MWSKWEVCWGRAGPCNWKIGCGGTRPEIVWRIVDLSYYQYALLKVITIVLCQSFQYVTYDSRWLAYLWRWDVLLFQLLKLGLFFHEDLAQFNYLRMIESFNSISHIGLCFIFSLPIFTNCLYLLLFGSC